MGVEVLRAALEEQGRTRVAEILEAGEVEARRLLEGAQEAATRRRDERLRLAEAALRKEARARIAAARRDARRRVLTAREDFLERFFAGLSQELERALGQPAARAWITARAKEGLAYLPEGPLRITAAPGVAPWLADALAGRDGVRVEVDPALAAGFVASTPDGGVSVDATPTRWIELRRAQLAIEALRRLDFAGPGGDLP